MLTSSRRPSPSTSPRKRPPPGRYARREASDSRGHFPADNANVATGPEAAALPQSATTRQRPNLGSVLITDTLSDGRGCRALAGRASVAKHQPGRLVLLRRGSLSAADSKPLGFTARCAGRYDCSSTRADHEQTADCDDEDAPSLPMIVRATRLALRHARP
jgi:hypothetical protein